ncbi:DUF2953 domain-containing protein [Bacillus carboniphilus]|uniref:DUF2953 domain-containing protein n=1 Tax=Bacillus carboniphilus TaxID=86663 RepID=A0ABY9JY42_9BACI|nr:DUF2953 domain-containing protein [Bacillus carboniphilus]WLR44299.1 DUF2953 domain-containing protein [Bacillus carboniphilus]
MYRKFIDTYTVDKAVSMKERLLYVFWVGIVLALIFFLLFLFIITNVSIIITYLHEQDEDQLVIRFRAWFGLLKYKYEVPFIKMEPDSTDVIVKEEKSAKKGQKDEKTDKITPEEVLDSLKEFKEFTERVRGLNLIIKRFLQRVKIKRFEWFSILGMKDAATTGFLIGTAWTIKMNIVSIISYHFRLVAQPIVSVEPNFHIPLSKTSFTCMIRFRIGYAMLAAFRLLINLRGGIKTIRKTNSKAQEM